MTVNQGVGVRVEIVVGDSGVGPMMVKQKLRLCQMPASPKT